MKSLKLSYPVQGITEVSIKTFKVNYLRQLKQDYRNDGTIIYKMLGEITGIKDDNFFKKLSLIDSVLILFHAWNKTHHKTTWKNTKIVCSDKLNDKGEVVSKGCGAMADNEFIHNLVLNYSLPKEYIDLIELAAYNDDDVLERYKLKLKPITLDLAEKLFLLGENIELTDVVFNQLESVNGSVLTDLGALPIVAIKAVQAKLPPDMETYTNLLQVKQKCVNCDKELISEIGFMNFAWIMDE